MTTRAVIEDVAAVDLLVVFVVGEWHIGFGLYEAEGSAQRQTFHCSEDSELFGGVDSGDWHIDSSSSAGTGGTSC